MTRTEVVTKAIEGKIRWIDAANILGVSARQVLRLKRAVERNGIEYFMTVRGKARRRRIALRTFEELKRLKREQYEDFSVRHFYEQATEKHGLKLSYGTCLRALQEAGLAEKLSKRGTYRRKRERRAMSGMMLHIDASTHAWMGGELPSDLVVVLDDADGKILYAQLHEQEGTRSTLHALEHVLKKRGRFAELYHDRGTHYGKASANQTDDPSGQVQRVCAALGIRQIFSRSPEARGRSERCFGTLQGRLPQELRVHDIRTTEAANRYLRDHFIDDFNRRFSVKPKQKESAFVAMVGLDMELLVSEQHQRTVGHDNTIHFQGTLLQLESSKNRASYARCKVKVHQLLNGTLAVTFSGKCIARFNSDGQMEKKRRAA